MDPENVPETVETNVETVKEKDAKLFKLSVTAFLLLLVFGLAYYIHYGMNNTPATQSMTEEVEKAGPVGITEQEKIDILNSLKSDDEDAIEVSNEEKRDLLSRLQENNVDNETQEPVAVSEEEKRSILESLSASE